MARGNHTGKGGFGDRPQDINKSPVRKGTREKMNDFKAWVFKVFETNKDLFVNDLKYDKKVRVDFLKLAASLCPKEVELGNKYGEPLLVSWQK